MALVVPVMKSGYTIKFADILQYQHINGPIINSFSGAMAFAAMLLCIQAKLGYVPFDMPEAETELMAGPYIEYSGKALGLYKISKAILTFIVPILMITLFMGGVQFGVWNFLKKTVVQYLLIVVAFVLIKNTNPRVRIDQSMRFFWGPVTALAVLSAALAYLGH